MSIPPRPGTKDSAATRAGKTASGAANTDQSDAFPLVIPPWPPNWPEVAESVQRALQSGDWGRYRGESVEDLARQIRHLCDSVHCRLVSSGSLGVEIALRSVGVTAGDRVVLCGYDYPGNFRAIEVLGARPVLADAALNSFSVSPDDLLHADAGSVKAVIVSHLYGLAAQIDRIREICDQRSWMLVEDACQTPGMKISGRPAGSWGDVGVLSFGGSKPLTAGNGGALVTSNDTVASKWAAWLDRPSDSTPMSELQAAAVLPQLDRLDQCNADRWETASSMFRRVEWVGEAVGERVASLGAVFYKLAFLSDQRDRMVRELSAAGVPVGNGYRSMHRSSNRRCDKLSELEQCRILGEQVCLIDHAALLAKGEQQTRFLELLESVG